MSQQPQSTLVVLGILLLLVIVQFSTGIIKDKVFMVLMNRCVSNVHTTKHEIPKLGICTILCLADSACLSATYKHETQQCQLSDNEVLVDCPELGKLDGTITSFNYEYTLGDSCTQGPGACGNILYALCGASSHTCECADGFEELNGVCTCLSGRSTNAGSTCVLASVGDSCGSYPNQRACDNLANAQCREGDICACDSGYRNNSNGDGCVDICESIQFCDSDSSVRYTFRQIALSWTDAQDACQTSGGVLAVFTTETQVDTFHDIRGAQSTSSFRYTTGFWIGLQDTTGLFDWEWTDGTGLAFTTRWSMNEPSHPNGTSDSFCAADRPVSQGGNWNDDECYKSKSYVCMFNL